MKAFRAAGVLALTALALTACDSEDTTGVTTADLEGSWSATSFAYTDAENSTLSLDAIDFGGIVTLDVAQSGAFTGSLVLPTVTPPGESVPISGTIQIVDENTLHVDLDAATEALGLFEDFDASYELDGDVLTWANHDAMFDFPDTLEEAGGIGARGEVAAILTARFER